MAQKKKVPAKSSAKSAPKVKAAQAVKPSKKVEAKSVPKKPAPKSEAKVAPKSAKPAAKAVSKASETIKTSKSAPKAAEKKVGAAAPVAPKAAPSKPAVAAKAAAGKPAEVKPVEKSVQPAAKQVAPAKAPAAPEQPAAARPAAPAAAQPKTLPPVIAARAPVQFGTPAQARSVPSALPKPAMRSFPAPGAATAPAAGVPRDIAQKTADARQQQMASAVAGGPKKPVTSRHGFKINESIVYPAHGVGRIIGIEEQEIAGMLLELFVIQFEKDKMTLKVPSGKLQTVGMRKLAEDGIVGKAMETLKGRARVKRTMWSRRAQEYEAKINSGDLVAIAEVVRDLYRSENQPEQSYSERQLYEAALDRMAREIAAVLHIDERGAVQRITEVLAKSAKGRRAAEASEPAEGSDGDSDSEGEADAQAA